MTGALDEDTENQILELFAELQRHGTRFVIATHSSRVAAACDRVLAVSGHRLVPHSPGRPEADLSQ